MLYLCLYNLFYMSLALDLIWTLHIWSLLSMYFNFLSSEISAYYFLLIKAACLEALDRQ